MTTHLYSNFSLFNIHGLAIEDAYTKLDQEINELQERLCSLRTLRNSLAPISRIPPEILSKIFVHTQEYTDSPFTDEDALCTRFFISWVSRHWRTIAIATRRLWSTISPKDKDRPLRMYFTQELLVRSGNSNLAVNLFEPDEYMFGIIHPEMHRIEHLRVHDTAQSIGFVNLVTQAAPVLASLELAYLVAPETRPY